MHEELKIKVVYLKFLKKLILKKLGIIMYNVLTTEFDLNRVTPRGVPPNMRKSSGVPPQKGGYPPLSAFDQPD